MAKWIFGIVAAVIGVPVVAAIALVTLVNPNDYKPELETLVKDSTGRELTLRGDIGLTLFPWLGFEAEGVTLANKAGFSAEPMLSIQRAEARLKLLPLFTGQIEVGKVLLDRPTLVVGIDKDGSMSWSDLVASDAAAEPASSAEAAASDSSLPAFGLASFEVSEASLKWLDKAAGTTTTIEPFNLTVGKVAKGDTFPLALSANVVQGQGDDQLTVELDVAGQALLTDQQLELKTLSIKALLSMAGLQPIETTLDSALVAQVDGSKVALTQLQGAINTMELSGDLLATNLNSRPDIKLNLAIDTVNTDDFLLPSAQTQEAKEASAEQTEAERQALNKTPVDVAALRDIDMVANITAQQLIASGLRASNLQLKALLKNGLLNLKPFSFDLYEGQFSAQAQVNAGSQPARFSWQHQLTKVNSEPMQLDVMEKAYVGGALAMQAAINTRGATVGALRQALQGNGSLEFTDGAIKGINIAGLLRKAIAKFKNEPLPEGDVEVADTDFSSATASFTIVNGVMNNPDLLVESPLIRITGAGDVNLVNETVDYRARPMVVATLEGQGGRSLDDLSGVPIPVRCTGALSAPDCRTDIAAAVKEKTKQAFDQEKDQAKQKLQEKLDDKVKDIFNKWR